MTVIDWIVVGLYFILLFVIGYQTTKRIKDDKDYNIAGGRIIWPVTFATLAASFLGGGASFGLAGNVFESGYVFMFAFFAYAIAMILSGYFVAPRLKSYKDAQTVGDAMEEHYGKIAKLLTGIFSIGLCAGVLGAQVLAVGDVFHVILGISPILGILIGMGAVILYSSAGGLWAVIQTDVVQFIFLGIFLPLMMIIGIYNIGGPQELINNIPHSHFTFLGDWKLSTFLDTAIIFFLGEALIPPYTQRAFSSKDANNSKKGFVASGLFSLGFNFIAATLGLIALILYPSIESDLAIPTLVKNILPIGISGLVVSALLAVIMSSASSLLNATTVSFMRDIYIPFIKQNSSTRSKLLIERILTLIVGIASIIFALKVPSIIDALKYSYYLWAPTIVFPFSLGVIFKIYSKSAGLSAIIGGGIITSVWTWIFKNPFNISGVIPGVIVNILLFIIVYNLTKSKGRVINEDLDV